MIRRADSATEALAVLEEHRAFHPLVDLDECNSEACRALAAGQGGARSESGPEP